MKEQLPAQTATAQEKARALLDQTKKQVKTAAGQGEDTSHPLRAEAKAAFGPATLTAQQQAVNGTRAEEAQAQLRRDLKIGSENPA